jgi:hypothetical protein
MYGLGSLFQFYPEWLSAREALSVVTLLLRIPSLLGPLLLEVLPGLLYNLVARRKDGSQ